ncbi:MAG: MtrB/PioB family decaheme-associated outer membrane protein [Acidobacteria bacterium]|nr:MtrB/PioB family decaheme-associated outer membrane protein [Acidobacteriota bacterium]
MKAKARLGAALLLWLCGPGLRGQSDEPTPEVRRLRQPPQRTVLEIGSRNTSGDTGSAKFSEYRRLPDGAFLRDLNFEAELPVSGHYFQLRSRENSESDLQSLATAGAYGRYKISLSWIRLFHTVPTRGRNSYERTGPGKFTLPSGFQALQGAPSQNLLLKREWAGLGITLTPRESWDFRAQYSPERRTGYRPVGNNFLFTAVELPEPVEYRTDDLKLSAEFARPKWVVRGSSESSLFHNDVQTLEWSGPFAPNQGSAAPATGRKALAPDNAAQNFTVAGALNLSRLARIVATVSPGWMHQNEAFVPFTSNSVLQALPGYPALPAPSLDGSKQTLMMNYLLTGRVKKQFTYNVRYRSYRLDNQTPSLQFSNYVITDSELPASTRANPRSRRNLPYGYTKQDAGLDWIWAPNKTSSAKAFYQWESWDRTYRDVRRSQEHTAGASWDWMSRDGWGVQALFQHSQRRPGQYDAASFRSGFPAGTGFFALEQLPELRRFDEAQRSRNYGTILVQAPPIKSFQLSASYTLDRSFFNESRYGDLYNLSDGASGNLAYVLTSSVSIFADYTFERLRYALRSRQRLDAAAAADFNDSSNNDWESKIRDWVHTWGAGVNAGLLHNRLVLDVYYGFSQGANTTATAALGSPTVAGFLVSTAEDYPRLGNRFQRLTTSLKIPIVRDIFYRIEYAYERYGETDLALDRAVAFPGLTNSGAASAGFLGMSLPRYRVQIWSLSLGYVF